MAELHLKRRRTTPPTASARARTPRCGGGRERCRGVLRALRRERRHTSRFKRRSGGRDFYVESDGNIISFGGRSLTSSVSPAGKSSPAARSAAREHFCIAGRSDARERPGTPGAVRGVAKSEDAAPHPLRPRTPPSSRLTERHRSARHHECWGRFQFDSVPVGTYKSDSCASGIGPYCRRSSTCEPARRSSTSSAGR